MRWRVRLLLVCPSVSKNLSRRGFDAFEDHILVSPGNISGHKFSVVVVYRTSGTADKTRQNEKKKCTKCTKKGNRRGQWIQTVFMWEICYKYLFILENTEILLRFLVIVKVSDLYDCLCLFDNYTFRHGPMNFLSGEWRTQRNTLVDVDARLG